MDKTTTDRLRKRLEVERDGLRQHITRIAKKDPKTPGDYDAVWPSYDNDERNSDNADNAQETEDYTNAIGVENVLELRLGAVERALARIESGTYGMCSNCSAEQPEARLSADPAAERCLECGKLV